MTLRTGLAVNSISIDAPDVRLGQAGLVVRSTSGAPRSGLFPHTTAAIVTSRADMRVNVAAFAAAFSRSATYGAIFFGNDGTIQSPLLAAPTANSWIYLLYVMVPDTTAGNAAAVPSLQVVQGDAAAVPTKPVLPTGGLELATITIPSTATTTQSANVVITQTFQYTATQGSPIFFRTDAEVKASAGFPPATPGYAIDTKTSYRFDGTAWLATSDSPRTARYTTLAGGVPDGSFNAGSVTAAGGVNNDFAAAGSGGQVSLTKPGVYLVTYQSRMGVSAPASGRSGYVQIESPVGTTLARSAVGPVEDTASAAALVLVTAASAVVQMSFFKQGGGTPNVTGDVTIAKVV